MSKITNPDALARIAEQSANRPGMRPAITRNPHAFGSVEWHAWNNGHGVGLDKRKRGRSEPMPSPVADTWSREDPRPNRQAVHCAAWMSAGEPYYNAIRHAQNECESGDYDVSDAYVSGYRAAWGL